MDDKINSGHKMPVICFLKRYTAVVLFFSVLNISFAQESGNQPDFSEIQDDTELVETETPEITDENVFSLLFDRNPDISRKAEFYIMEKTPDRVLPDIFQKIARERNGLLFERLLEIALRYPFEKSGKYWKELMKMEGPEDFQISIIKKYGSFSNRDIVFLLSEKIDSPHFSVREAACIELEKLRNDRTFTKVFNMAFSKSPVKRLYASQALYYLYDRRFVSVVGGMMKDENKSVRLYTLRIIRKYRLEELSYLVKSAAQSDVNYEVKAEAMRVMVAMKNNTALYVFSRNLDDKMPEVRYSAAQGILYFGYSAGIYAASKQLEVETDDSVKNILIDVHIRLRHGGGFAGLKKIIEHETNSHIKVKAVYAAGLIGGSQAENLLLTALEDGDFRVRAEAASGLSSFRSRQVMNRLLSVVENDKSQYVRTSALYALQNIKNRELAVKLNELLANEKDMLMKKIISDCIDKMN